ncbi:MAG: ATP-dependent protease, partial [Patescibacteria group bacterium]
INVPRETATSAQEILPVEKFRDLRNKISVARNTQQERFKKLGIFTNAEITYKNVDKLCLLTDDAEKLLEQAVTTKGLSLRSYHKIKKLSSTIAALDGSEKVGQQHVAEAISLKINDKLLSEMGN